jgi:hypothetical protein
MKNIFSLLATCRQNVDHIWPLSQFVDPELDNANKKDDYEEESIIQNK